jgi:ABC-type cobalamin/Fe3+-siderophores transport system ATPase subunit
VSIGVEIVSLPLLLFLDEPTSGLDSVTSLEVMTFVRHIAHHANRTVIATIHQVSNSRCTLTYSLTPSLPRSQPASPFQGGPHQLA